MQLVTFLEYTVAVVGTYLLFHLAIYVSQRFIIHRPYSGVLYRAHTIGHHGVYAKKDYDLPGSFRGYRQSWLNDYGVGLPPLALAYFFLPAHLFAVVAAEAILLGLFVAWAHRSVHTRGHWLKRLPVFRSYDALHRVHHGQLGRNYGFLFLGWDRVFGTYAPPHTALTPRSAGTSSGGTAGDRRYPWKRSQPISRSSASCAVVSTPSATSVKPRA